VSLFTASTALVSKARDSIEPAAMTQVVTKAKEMGKKNILPFVFLDISSRYFLSIERNLHLRVAF
jgi:hypothetical protein